MSAILIQPSAAAGFASLFGQINKGSGDTLNIPEGMINIGGNSHGYMLAAQTDWDPVSNDDGSISSLSLGDDIYVYAVQPASGAYAELVASKNSAVPTGYTASNSRKIGGFHVGRVRPISKRYDASFNPSTEIVPNSCWDLQHRPKCDPSGMVEVVPGSLWADIYMASEGAGSWPDNVPVSRYGATLIRDTAYVRTDYHVLVANAGKRLPKLSEFFVYADGAPQGSDNNNDTAWSKTSNTGPTTAGDVAKAVSTLNVVDAVGNLWDWLDEYYDSYGDNSRGFRSDVVDVGKDSGKDRGKAYVYNTSGNPGRDDGNNGVALWRGFHAGGSFVDGAFCGARCFYSDAFPWNAFGNRGFRGVCDAL